MKKLGRFFQKILHGFYFAFVMFLYFVSFPLAYILYKRKHYWLVAETDFDARDNGYHFFKYLNEKHPEINSLYLIHRDNPNYKKVSKIGKIIKPKSFKHFLIFIAADAKISSLVFGCSPNSYLTKHLLKHHGTGKNIALKHGLFKNLHPNYFKKNAHLDLICCGAKPEFDFVDKNFGYESGVASYTGLARFDALHNIEVESEIFVMPTWRRWLDGFNAEDFAKSDYFINWHNFLNNGELQGILEENNLKLTFYVHPKLNKYLPLYNVKNTRISFLNSLDGDSVQSHLKSAKVLITDFSSVFFDFAYMKKPTLYFQFDEKKFYESHYEKAYFDYRDNGFGPVSSNVDGLIKDLSLIVKKDFAVDNMYKKRFEEFFPLNDTNNCERIFESISKLLK